MSVTFENVTVVAETYMAIRVRLDDESKHWVPKSQLDEDSEVFKTGTDGKLVISEWFATKEGLV